MVRRTKHLKGSAFGAAYKDIRERYGLSFRDIRRAGGPQVGHSSRLQSGHKRPDLGTIEGITNSITDSRDADTLYWTAGFVPPDLAQDLPPSWILDALEKLRHEIHLDRVARGPRIVKVRTSCERLGRDGGESSAPTEPSELQNFAMDETFDLSGVRSFGTGEGLP